MDAAKLPKRLRKEPLIDAVFECRFDARVQVSSILPGIFFSELQCEKRIERLPHSQIPEQIRNVDPNLQYTPLVRVWAGDYSYLIGDRSVAVACNLPYKGWDNFRAAIVTMADILRKSGIIEKIDRYSMKYVDIIDSSDLSEQASLANMSLRIGRHKLESQSFQVRMEVPIDNLTNIIQILSGAKVTLQDNTSRDGLIIDIDTINLSANLPIGDLDQQLGSILDHAHNICKSIFFDCLTEKTLDKLEPEYD